MEYKLTEELIETFKTYLIYEEKSSATVEKYIHNVKMFYHWLEGRVVSKEVVMAWKDYLLKIGRAPVTINTSLASLHSLFSFARWNIAHVKYLKIQRRVFRDVSKELNQEEYNQLIRCANQKGKERLSLVMETICATGIRISELKYITVEAIKKGRADISLKGKIRTILITGKLARKLQKYAQKQKISSGEIFLTASQKSLSRRQIWGEMKQLCKEAKIDKSKVFPHNLRHLFSKLFYKLYRDIVKLADILGHSSIETTRIYLMETGEEHARQLEELGVVL